jgi:beta-galactosidase
VSVPHTWNRVGYYLTQTAARVNTPERVNKMQGVGWYRLGFTPPASYQGKKAWLEFDAASRTAEVWLNGIRLGAHTGGFSRFRLDATGAIKPGAPNLLVVRTDNSLPATGSSTVDVLPLAGDFFVHGGLYRPVRLVATSDVHIDMLDLGGPGVYASTRSVRNRVADVAVRTRVSNDSTAVASVEVLARLLDHRGATVARSRREASVQAGETATTDGALSVQKARLWHGVADPYLYRLVVEVRANGRLLDRLEEPFGIRQMQFDPQRGFLLNGNPVRLHGVGLHQDVEGKGWAVTRQDIDASVRLIREMGANTIRLTHYQHGPVVHELADRFGLILWDEIPLVSAWTAAPGQKVASAGLRANARTQLQELIRQNYNHASVAVWGIANEVDFGNSSPAFLASGSGEPPDPLPLLEELNRLAKSEDPTRPTTQANCCEGRMFGPNIQVPTVAPITDVSGANLYFDWYYGRAEDLGPHLESIHQKRPGQAFAVSEYGAGGAITMHTDNPLGGAPDSRGRAQPEEYQSYVHERMWAVLKSKPYLWATWLWNSFDFATTVRHEGDSEDINTKGLVTYDRTVKKDAFFFYKANWTTTPTVHVTSGRYVERAYPVTDVRVYSNAPTTELTVNGRAVPVQKDCEDRVCVWKGVRLAEGENAVVATGRFSSGAVRDRVSWRLAAGAVVRFAIDSGALLASAAKSGRYGSDNFFEGGEARTVNRPADYGRPAERKTLSGTDESDVMATYREGTFRYRVPVMPGTYRVRLAFVEPVAGVGQRVFDVLTNGERKLAGLDVAAAAGGALKTLERTFEVRVSGGELDLQFVPSKGQALVSAVNIERAP